jgi:capsular polysaccharide transport system permease protein
MSDRVSKKKGNSRLATLGLFVALPTTAAAGYLFFLSSDQYVSEFEFTVRQQHPLHTEGSGMAAALGGGNPMLAILADSEVVTHYLKSRQAVDDTSKRLDLDSIYGRPDADPLSRLEPGSPPERKLRYWQNVVDPFFDMTSGIVTVKVRAFTPDDARRVAEVTLAESERLVNDMATKAHSDAVSYAQAEVDRSEARLKKAEVDMAAYRNAHSVLYPAIEATAQTSLKGIIGESLSDTRARAQALSAEGVSANSPQLRMLRDRAAGLQAQVGLVQSGMARQDQSQQDGATMASVLSGYRALEVEEELSTKSLEGSNKALADARNEANEQLVYLDAFVRPATPVESLYPVRWKILLETALGGLITWMLGMLFVHGVKDHLD